MPEPSLNGGGENHRHYNQSTHLASSEEDGHTIDGTQMHMPLANEGRTEPLLWRLHPSWRIFSSTRWYLNHIYEPLHYLINSIAYRFRLFKFLWSGGFITPNRVECGHQWVKWIGFKVTLSWISEFLFQQPSADHEEEKNFI